MSHDELRVVREIELPAPADEVWAALTDPDRVGEWFGGQVDWELCPGGAAAFTVDGESDGDGGGDQPAVQRVGEIDEVWPGRRLTFRWWPKDRGPVTAGGASAVRYELEPVPGGTRLVVTETPITASPTAMACSSTFSRWDVRLVALWLGCSSGSLARV